MFLVLQRAAVLRFFRTMQVGVALVSLALLAVALGVLVPQITGFEDPTERVPDVRDIPSEVFDAYVPAPKMKSDEDFRRRPDDHPARAISPVGSNCLSGPTIRNLPVKERDI